MRWLCGAALLAASGCATPRQHQLALAAIATAPPGLAGVAGVVVDRRGERRAVAFGRAVIDPADAARERAMRPDVPVRAASISKLVTTLGIMRLVEAGQLDLDRDVSDYLGWRLRHPAFPNHPVTLRLLLSHRSALVDDAGYAWPLGIAMRDVLGPSSWHAAAPPGAVFSYANLNYGVAATVMEAATGERFDRLMVRLVFAPLGIDACYNWSGCSPEALARAAVLYRTGADETRWQPTGPWIAQIDDLRARPPTCPVRRAAPADRCDLARYRPGVNGTLFSPQGGLRISARDLGRIARLLLGAGEIDGIRLLRPASVRAMMTVHWRFGQATNGETYGGLMRCWGLSLQCLVGARDSGDQPLRRRTRWWGHLGDAYGLWSGLWIDPAAGRGYVYVVTGTADNPAGYPGRRSRFRSFEEAILGVLAR